MEIYWLEQSARHVPAGDYWLTAAETARLQGFRFPKRREDWRLGRWTAKHAVAGYLGITDIAAVEVRNAPSGAPRAFVYGQPAPISISLSHRGGLCVCALAGGSVAVGCDVELIEEREASFLADYFTCREQAFVAGAPVGDRPRLVTLLWSSKESALKALQKGLRLDTRVLEVTHTGYSLHIACPGGTDFRGWWFQSGGFVRTVVSCPFPAELIPLAAICPAPEELRRTESESWAQPKTICRCSGPINGNASSPIAYS